MTRIFAYFLTGCLFLLVQTTVLPRIFPFFLKPDLMLVLIIYLGLNESYVRGGLFAYLFGCMFDVFAGHYLGLYGLTFLATVFPVRGLADRLNTESSLLLLFLVFAGTFFQGVVLFFALGFFAEATLPLRLFIGQLLPQAMLNLATALLLLHLLPFLQRRFAPRSGIPGLRRLNDRYGS